MTSPAIMIGLSAVVFALREGEARVLTVRPRASSGAPVALEGLPFGPFDPEGHRTFELALREFVARQTRFQLGYVEQLYTFGDKGRDAPLADLGGGAARVISVGYLGLAPAAEAAQERDVVWSDFGRFFPWEDWRAGRPGVIDTVLAPALEAWAGRSRGRGARARALFALDGALWNEERVLERFELLYEAGLAPEAARDRARAAGAAPVEATLREPAFGEPMVSDHRRILATALGRLRGKLRYRPIIFELLDETFTLSALQRAMEAVSGIALHKQNFRRAVERTGLVEGIGRTAPSAPGRPAELFRFRRHAAAARPSLGLSLPRLRD